MNKIQSRRRVCKLLLWRQEKKKYARRKHKHVVDCGCKRQGLFYNLGIMISSAEYNYTNLIASVCRVFLLKRRGRSGNISQMTSASIPQMLKWYLLALCSYYRNKELVIGIKSQELLQCNNNFEKLNRVFNIHGTELFSPPIFRVTTNIGREYFHLSKIRRVTKED